MASEETERWSSNGIELTWWPSNGLMEMRWVVLDAQGTGADAQAFTDQIERWTGTRTAGFGILVDCSRIVDSDPAWRAMLSEYFRHRTTPMIAAWFNTSILIRVMVEMFVLATRIRGKVFSSEAAARAFLREAGFG